MEIKASKIELKTHVLFKGGKRVPDSKSIDVRRQSLMDNVSLFGGLEGLIESDQPYKVYYSEGVYKLFSQKYEELV